MYLWKIRGTFFGVPAITAIVFGGSIHWGIPTSGDYHLDRANAGSVCSSAKNKFLRAQGSDLPSNRSI